MVEGARWIARALLEIDEHWFELRSRFMQHAITEHRDFKMIEQDYVSVGGRLEDIVGAPKNIGTEALHAFIFHRAEPAQSVRSARRHVHHRGARPEEGRRMGPADQGPARPARSEQVSFLLYHGENDEAHMQEFEDTLTSGILAIPDMDKAILKTAKVTARLYRLQLEELGNT